ncbi:hypothetical protein VB711_22045 [Cronbergia sp. UHCC 0137]|uniref:hypothetical protein n=1 Tax=Cronbergia sp. UHCC 0137 TaxID=3110239 RepID=UPI002B20148E|nr:hypothetical protein [Cronbergia sp. UHCC 0137]MEA5620502.1 hypothetical protein [Cronbergia sp. UHCC 0137]
MKFITLGISSLRPLQFLFLIFTCTLLFLFSSFPAFAISSYQSQPEEGTTQLLETQRKTDEVAKSPPITLKESQQRTKKGLNAVQGDADIEKMKTPENSQDATSVEEEVKNFLKEVTGNK